jgi:hypothetical protein
MADFSARSSASALSLSASAARSGPRRLAASSTSASRTASDWLRPDLVRDLRASCASSSSRIEMARSTRPRYHNCMTGPVGCRVTGSNTDVWVENGAGDGTRGPEYRAGRRIHLPVLIHGADVRARKGSPAGACGEGLARGPLQPPKTAAATAANQRGSHHACHTPVFEVRLRLVTGPPVGSAVRLGGEDRGAGPGAGLKIGGQPGPGLIRHHGGQLGRLRAPLDRHRDAAGRTGDRG